MRPEKHQLIVATDTPLLIPAIGMPARGNDALSHTVASHGGAWVAAAGNALPGCSWVKPVLVGEEDLAAHRGGYCAQTLAPAYFGHHGSTVVQQQDWQAAHHTVMQQYAQAIDALAAPGAAVWVHDYPLQLLPGLLRQLRPDLRIGFSLHSPFPPAQILWAIAERDRITASLLAADLATFADARSAANFVACDGAIPGPATVMPMPADTHAIAHAATTATVRAAAGRIRARLRPATTVFLSIGGADSGDGTLARLHAFAQLLDSGALTPQQAVLMHLAPALETPTGESSQLRQDIERLTAQINGKHGTLGHLPVHYQRHDLSTAEQAAFYLAADVMLATPLRDRATPHAAEYAAARAIGCGRLVLSEFSTTTGQLPGAIVVNPHEPGALEQAMLAAAADADVASPVMTRMSAHALSDDVTTWAQNFLKALTSGGSPILPEPASHHPVTTARRSPIVRLRQEGIPHRAQPADPAGQLAATAHP